MIANLKKQLPLRDVPLATAYTTVCLVALWLSNYPTGEWIEVAAVGYVSLWVSRELTTHLTIFSLRRLRDHGLRSAERSGGEIPDGVPGSHELGSLAFIPKLFLLAVIVTIVGLSLTATSAVVSGLGLSPLDFRVSMVGMVMLGAGMTVFGTFFAISLILFAGAEAVSNKLKTRVNRIEQSEIAVSRLLREQRQTA